MTVVDDAGKTHRLDLGTEEAFEDRGPRIGNLEGGDEQDIVAVRSNLADGSRLTLIKLEGEGLLRIAAESSPTGVAHAWINPLGFGDFFGSGRTEIAAERTQPDGTCKLDIIDYADHTFATRMSIKGCAIALPGSAITALGAIAAFGETKAAGVALLNADLRGVRILTFDGGAVAEPGAVPLWAEATTEMRLLNGLGSRPALLIGLADGSLALVK
jgi:hypothetical protein